jgi:hypothetical protein
MVYTVQPTGATSQLHVQQIPFSEALITGIDTNIRVIPTPQGNAASQAATCSYEKNPAFISVQLMHGKVETLISNEEIRRSVDVYRLLKGIYTLTTNELGALIKARRGSPLSPRYKFINLYKFDAFSNTWKFVAEHRKGVGSLFLTESQRFR